MSQKIIEGDLEISGALTNNGQPVGGGVTSVGGATGAITLGSGLTMTNNELSATGGGGGSGTQLYRHNFKVTDTSSNVYDCFVISTDATAYTVVDFTGGKVTRAIFDGRTVLTVYFTGNILSNPRWNISYIDGTGALTSKEFAHNVWGIACTEDNVTPL